MFIVNLVDRAVYQAVTGINCTFDITFSPNGSLTFVVAAGTYPLATEWMLYGAIEASTAALYEVRLTARDGGALNSGTAGAWLGLGVSRTFGVIVVNPDFGGGTNSAVNLRTLDWLFEVREIASTLVQDTAVYTVKLEARTNYPGGA